MDYLSNFYQPLENVFLVESFYRVFDDGIYLGCVSLGEPII
jgi:hypothetical protein